MHIAVFVIYLLVLTECFICIKWELQNCLDHVTCFHFDSMTIATVMHYLLQA
jgi:hypothetical protein